MLANLPENFKTDYFAASNDVSLVTKFWNTYNNRPLEKIQAGQHWLVREYFFNLLSTCKTLDQNSFTKIHKGHPFYFIGITSFLMEDFQTAVYFFDASMTEDFNAGADPKDRAKPSTRFLMMEGEVNGHTAQPLAALAKAQVERVITYYLGCSLISGQTLELDIEKVRNNFIYRSLTTKDKPGLRTLTTAFISYFIEWDFRNRHFEYGVKQGTSEPFFLHLFRGCVLFESLLKHNPEFQPKEINLGGILKNTEILTRLKINQINTGNFTLDNLYQKLNGYVDTITLDESIQITYMARNILGHNLGWDDKINQEQYQKLYFIIAASCLHVIACLWN